MTAALVGEVLDFDVAPLVRVADSAPTIQERFELFQANNPWVLRALEHLVEDWLAMGNKRVGIKQLFEVIRWQYGRKTTGEAGFGCNNDFTSRYARLLLDRHPEWVGAIETRELKTP